MKSNFHSFSIGEGFTRVIQALLIAVLCVPIGAFAQTPVQYEELKLLAFDSSEDDHFGSDVALTESMAVVGARFGDGIAPETGVAYVFERQLDDTWVPTYKLSADDGDANHYFGYSVAISGDTVVVGAVLDRSDQFGSAYVFERQPDATWIQTQKLLSSEPDRCHHFGFDVAIEGNVILIGDPYEHDIGISNGIGAVSIFERQLDGSWLETAKLRAGDSTVYQSFGHAVAVSGELALIGAREIDDSGSAYIFERLSDGSWLENDKLTAHDGAAEDLFATEGLSILGGTAIIGAPKDDDNGTESGSVYLFERQLDGSWLESVKLVASDGAEGDQFGHGVAISGDQIVIGSVHDGDNGDYSGSGYVFSREADGTWLEISKLLASDGAEGDTFGMRVALSNETALLGAHLDDTDVGTNSGSAYVFTVSDPEEGCDPVVNPLALDFSAIEIGETVTLATTLANEGSEACDVTANVESPSGEFVLGTATNFAVAPSESADVLVDYTPVDMGDDTGTLELVIADPASQIDVPLTGSAVEGVFNLNIAQFKVSKVIRYRGDETKLIRITLKVSNEGTIGGTASVTVIGILAGEEIYVASDSIDVGVGSAPQTVTFPAYQPVAVGDITWTVTVNDGYPDVDEATAVTSVR